MEEETYTEDSWEHDSWNIYHEQKAEAEACGEEFPSYAEWKGEYNREADFKDKWQKIYDNDEQDLY